MKKGIEDYFDANYFVDEADDSKRTVRLFKNREVKINDLLKHFGIFGISGSGKTVTLARLLEIYAENKIGFTVFDIEGTSFYTIPEVYPRVKFKKLEPLISDDLYEEITSSYKDNKDYFNNIRKQLDFTKVPEAQNAIKKIEQMAEKNYYTSAEYIYSFENIPDHLMGGCIAYIYTNKIFELSTDERILHIITYDEAQWAMPENHPSCPIDRTIYSSKLQTVCGRIMTQGRKRKLLLNLASQRSAFVSKAVTSQLENGLLMRAGPDDHDRYAKIMKNISFQARRELLGKVQNYPSGKALYVKDGYVNPTCQVAFRNSKHPDSSPSYYRDKKYADMKKREYYNKQVRGSAV